MTDAVVAQAPLEVASSVSPAAQLAQAAIEAASTVRPVLSVAQVAVEVLSSNVEATVDPTTAFFGFEPSGDVTERLTWNTDVQQALAGGNVRHALQADPDVTVEFDVLTPPYAVLLEALLYGWQAARYYLPVWQDRTTLASGLASGATSIATTTTGYAYAAGGLLALWTSPADFEIVEIASATGGTISFAAPTVRAWQAGASIAPVRVAKLAAEAAAALFTGASVYARLVFEIEEPVAIAAQEWGAASGGPWTADGFALFARRPNWADDPGIAYTRRTRTFGGREVPAWRDDPSGRGWTRRSHRHTLASRAEVGEFLAWAAQRRGRHVSFLAPLWNATLQVTRACTAVDTAIYVARAELATLYPYITPGSYLALRRSAGWTVRRVVGVYAVDADEEQIGLASAIGVAAAASEWLDVQFAEPVHLASDALELRYWAPDVADVVLSHLQVIA